MRILNKNMRAIVLLIGIVIFTIPTFSANITSNSGLDKILNITPSNRAVYLQGTGTGVTPLTYKWYEGNKYIGPGASRWYVIKESGQHEITLVVTDANGSKATDTMVVTVNNGVDNTITKVTANAGDDITHHVTPSKRAIYLVGSGRGKAPLTYKWYENGKFIGTGAKRWYVMTQTGQHKITLLVTDADGNEARDTMNVSVEGVNFVPNNAPTLTITGDNPLRLDTTQLFIDPGATAHDKEDGDLTSRIKVVSTVQNQTAGTYDVRYTVEDNGRKTTTKVRRVIYTAKSNELPLIEMLGDNPLLLNQGEVFIEPGVIGRDKEDGIISHKIKTVLNTIDSSKVGTYEVKYELTDSGNATVHATRRVSVVSNGKPVILLIGDSTVYLNLGEDYVERGATARDREDGDITSQLVIDSSHLNTAKAGEYNIVYTVKDSDNNIQSITRKVIVKSDTKGTLTGVANNITLKHIGSGVGGAMFAIGIDPKDKNNIFFSGDMGVVYHTINGGQSWNIVPGMDNIRFIKFDPNNSNTIWAGGGSGLYKSIDGGLSWNHTLNLRNYAASLGAIAIDPTDSNIIYVAEGFVSNIKISWVRGKVWKSIDAGLTWRELTRPGGEIGSDSIYNRNYSTMIIDPNSTYIAGKGHTRLYLVGRDGIFRSEDGGDSWHEITFFDAGQGADMVLVDKNGHSILFASVIPILGHTKKGIYRSDNNGASWSAKNSGLLSIVNRLESRNKDIKNLRQFSLMLAHSSANNKLYTGSWQGIVASDDLGESWYEVAKAETPYIRHFSGIYLAIPSKNRRKHADSFFGGIDNLIKIKVSQSDPDFVIFGDNQDLHISSDGGATWHTGIFDYGDKFEDSAVVIPTLPEESPKNRYTHKIKSRGVQGTVNTDVAVDPFDSQVYYATYMDIGFQVTRDAGVTWEHPSNGIPARGHAWSVEVDPTVEGRLWVSAKETGNIYLSRDKGVTWEDVSIGDRTVGKVTDIVLDANSDENSRILYATTEKKGLYKSINSGQSWVNIFSTGSFDIKLNPVNSNILYLGTINGLYKSSNRGISWSKLATSQMGKVFNISVGKNNHIYVISNKVGKSSFWDSRKLWKSEDGVTFTDITPKFMSYIGGVAVNPINSNYIYISNFSKNQTKKNKKMIMARSKDGGLTWEQIGQNFAFTMGRDIYIDSKNAQHLFFNTNFSLIEAFDNEAPKK